MPIDEFDIAQWEEAKRQARTARQAYENRQEVVEIIFTPWPYDAVARGVALLDKRAPGWRVSDSADYLTELWQLAGEPDRFLHGFSTRWQDSYTALRNAWREAIVEGSK